MNYTNVDYNSPFGILTRVWGPIQWQFLHMMSFNYPVMPTNDDKMHYYNYVESLKYILPCRSCRENIEKNLKTVNFNMAKMKNRDTFSRFIYNLHNIVNVMLGKKNYLTYEEVRDRYELFRATCSQETATTESGCIIPVNKIKSRCVIHIVPLTKSVESFAIDKRCLPKQLKSKKISKKISKK